MKFVGWIPRIELGYTMPHTAVLPIELYPPSFDLDNTKILSKIIFNLISLPWIN